MRAEMGDAAVHAARSVGYEGAGTVEFLVADGKFYFLEVNARIQVEHPVTEMVTGIDIVKAQIQIASGMPHGIRQEEVRIHGAAIECRINAEDPLNDFVPAPGIIKASYPPGGAGIRVDSGICGAGSIPPFYDSMIAKLIAWGRDREEAIRRMQRALREYILVGIRSNIPFHLAVMQNERFLRGELSTHFIAAESSLAEDMRRIAERQRALQDRLPHLYEDKKKMVAAAVAAVLASARIKN
jgi:pyruvate carboxylase subunit A